MMTEAALYEALRQVGLNLSTLEDVVHAAKHLINQGRVKLKVPEETTSGD
jgi:hypothetical protein